MRSLRYVTKNTCLFFSAKENELGVPIFVLNGGFEGIGEIPKP